MLVAHEQSFFCLCFFFFFQNQHKNVDVTKFKCFYQRRSRHTEFFFHCTFTHLFYFPCKCCWNAWRLFFHCSISSIIIAISQLTNDSSWYAWHTVGFVVGNCNSNLSSRFNQIVLRLISIVLLYIDENTEQKKFFLGLNFFFFFIFFLFWFVLFLLLLL